MNKINLIKHRLLVGLSFLIFSQALSVSADPIFVRDKYGNPIPHAMVKIGTDTVISVSEEGSFELPQNFTSDQWVEVHAMGYDVKKIQVKEFYQLNTIDLNEKIGQMGEVVVAATRTDRSVENLPMPVNIISRKQIQETGAMRLSEVLREQTGLQVVGDHGSGLQMQGLSSDYILILLDGEPLIGRTAGTFDLDRISVSNIERIEVLRGPTIAIYGSEAMAGVINIITKNNQKRLMASIESRYRSFNTLDISGEVGINKEDWNLYTYFDRYSTEGFDLSTEEPGKTQSPYSANTAQLKLGRKSNKWELKVYSRYYRENSDNFMQVIDAGNPRLVDMTGERLEFNLNPTISYRPNAEWLVAMRSMSSVFKTNTLIQFQEDRAVLDEQDFRQGYHRTEFQVDHQMDKKQLITLGFGHLAEKVDATRYDNDNRFDAGYFFLQHQWDPGEKWHIVTGIRGDLHSQYGKRLSPKISGMYSFSRKFSWQLSLGAGFKAPDFRQLLLNFNNASAGYYVFGASLAKDGIERLQSQGLVQQILLDPSQFGTLKAESSKAINTGFRWKISDDQLIQGNFFQNNISNLIETAPVARLTSGQNAFSYFNIANVITRGVELDWTYRVTGNVQLSLGYMFLDARDLDVLDRIANGEIYRRDSQNRTQKVSKSDYGGLFNRSQHSGNIKISYQESYSGINIALRGIHRGRFGFGDVNGNLILDDPSEYARSLTSWNITISKSLQNGMNIEVGGNNLTNQINFYDPTNPGRMLFLGAKLPFHQLLNATK